LSTFTRSWTERRSDHARTLITYRIGLEVGPKYADRREFATEGEREEYVAARLLDAEPGGRPRHRTELL
jgi:hypothetical protein